MKFAFVTIYIALLHFEDVASFTIDQVMISSSCCCESDQTCCANEENARSARNAEPAKESTLRRRKRESEESQDAAAHTATEEAAVPSVKISVVMRHTNLVWDAAMKDPQSLQYINTVNYLQSMMVGVLQHVSGFESYKIRRLMEGSIIQSGVAEVLRDSVEKYDIVSIMQEFLKEAINNPLSGLAQSGALPAIIRILPDVTSTTALVTETITLSTVGEIAPMVNFQEDNSSGEKYYENSMSDFVGENSDILAESSQTTQGSTTEAALVSSTTLSENQIARVTIALRFKNMTWNPAMMNHKFLQYKRTAKAIEDIMDETLSGVDGFKFYRVTNLQEGSVIQTGYAEMEVRRENATLSIGRMQDELFQAIENPNSKLAEGQAEVVDPNEIKTTTRVPRTKSPAELLGDESRFNKLESFINDPRSNHLIPTTSASQVTHEVEQTSHYVAESVSNGGVYTTETDTEVTTEDIDDVEDEVDAKDKEDNIDTVFDPTLSNIASRVSSSTDESNIDDDEDYDDEDDDDIEESSLGDDIADVTAVDDEVEDDKDTVFFPSSFSSSKPELKSTTNIYSSTEINEDATVGRVHIPRDSVGAKVYIADNIEESTTEISSVSTDNLVTAEFTTADIDDFEDEIDAKDEDDSIDTIFDPTRDSSSSTTESNNDVDSDTEGISDVDSATENNNEVESSTEGDSNVGETESNNDLTSTTESNNDITSTTESNIDITSTTENNSNNEYSSTESDSDVGSDTEYVINDVTETGNVADGNFVIDKDDPNIVMQKSGSIESFFHLDNIGVEEDEVITENINDIDESEMVKEKSNDDESFFHLDGLGVEEDAEITERVLDLLLNGTQELNVADEEYDDEDDDVDNDSHEIVTATSEENTEAGSDIYGNVITIQP